MFRDIQRKNVRRSNGIRKAINDCFHAWRQHRGV